jgi:CheY-like chemotaxis protein
MTSEGFVLVVDDDADARELLSDALEGRGYRTAEAANGKEALEVLRGRTSRACVILLDSSMPVMDGAQFRVEQTLDPALASVPVVMVTAAPREEGGPPTAGYLAKPIDLAALFALLEPLCRHGRRRPH